jgi:hypothetical protein
MKEREKMLNENKERLVICYLLINDDDVGDNNDESWYVD